MGRMLKKPDIHIFSDRTESSRLDIFQYTVFVYVCPISKLTSIQLSRNKIISLKPAVPADRTGICKNYLFFFIFFSVAPLQKLFAQFINYSHSTFSAFNALHHKTDGHYGTDHDSISPDHHNLFHTTLYASSLQKALSWIFHRQARHTL